jgi:hypothetical protein
MASKDFAERKGYVDRAMRAVDLRDRSFWSSLDDEEKKLATKYINSYMAQRWASSIQSNDLEVQEHYLLMVNDLCNIDYVATTSAHEELRWMVLSLIGLGAKLKHELIPPRGVKKDRIREWLIELYPQFGEGEIDLFREINPPDVLEESARAMNVADKRLKDLFK